MNEAMKKKCNDLTEAIAEILEDYDAAIEFFLDGRGCTILKLAGVTSEQYGEWADWQANMLDAERYGL